jgi:hypothetical protein
MAGLVGCKPELGGAVPQPDNHPVIACASRHACTTLSLPPHPERAPH